MMRSLAVSLICPSGDIRKEIADALIPSLNRIRGRFWLPGRIAGSYTCRAGPGNEIRNQLHARDFRPVPFPGNVLFWGS